MTLLSSILQGSILGPTLFINFINDLLLFTKDVELANFVDDNKRSQEQYRRTHECIRKGE